MAGAAAKFNTRNPAVKRIMQEMKEMREHSSREFIAEALESDIFEWHFVVRGPPDTEFEGGVYHGRILLPAEYPFKPPSFMMLSPNGRFETNVKICLSISSHHPEHWQPSWSVRTALTALIAFMPTPGAGALGALDYTKEERKKLAAKSRVDVPKYGSAERQRVIDDMHARMMAVEAESAGMNRAPSTEVPGMEEIAAVVMSRNTAVPSSQPEQAGPAPVSTPLPAAEGATAAAPVKVEPPRTSSTQLSETPAPSASAGGTASRTHSGVITPSPVQQAGSAQQQQQQQQHSISDRSLTLLAVALSLGIAALLIRKILDALGYDVRGGAAA
eukprot:CAMPEP_0202896150 /NCGR_PEP_ID=MMETSP1392-20130828/5201_1 /ASSEMBLY_ACC=CAM_ASM_000868 /TAXON_ID=225041 /ORGANISM="Chlamydomonas chlamydogama, Strain SAG 11-48b" /LENGTH=329 /DNA_ID=CAMNT_0049581395 /DNA_START=89 /DNA_END=1078 /DNA_ORIENTATION=-